MGTPTAPRRDHAAAAPASATSAWHALRAYPAFRVLFGSTLGTNSAFWMWNIASSWLALQLTDSAFFVGLTGFLGGIPTLIFSIPSGVILDRFDRRQVLLVAQGIVTAIAAVVALMLLLDRLASWHLLVACFLNGTAMSFVFPTRNALVANIVAPRDLANAVALNATGQNATRVVGPALAGPLIAALGVVGTFAACALCQIAALVVTLRLPRARPTPSATRSTLWGSLVEGLAVIWRSEYLTGLILLAAVPTLLVMPYSNLLSVFADHVLHIGATGLGLLMAANGAGAVLGSLAVAAWRRLTELPGVQVWTAAGFAAVVFAFALTPSPLVAGLLIFLAGALSAVYLAVNNTKIQLAVDDSVRGRVLGVYLLTWGLVPVGTLPAGSLANRYGAPLTVAILTALAFVLVLATVLRFPSLVRGEPARVETAERRP